MSVEITQNHIDHTYAIAYRLARQFKHQVGLVDADELRSEGLVVLWDLALTWDEDSGVPFGAYLSLTMHNRLIDWLRREYGRKGSARNDMSTGILSLDAVTEAGLQYEKPSHAPSVETVVTDRESLAEVATAIRGCTERQRDALLWPLVDGDLRAVEAKWGMTRSSAAAHRYQAKARISHARRAA